MFKLLFIYFGIITWAIGLIVLFVSQQYETVIQKYNLYPKDVNLLFRPWGFKKKEIIAMIDKTEIIEVENKLKRTLFLRNLGYKLLLVIPVQILVTTIYQIIVSFTA